MLYNLNIIYGAAINRKLKDELIVTVIATGYDSSAKDVGIEDLTSEIFKEYSQNQTKITNRGLVESETFEEVVEEAKKEEAPTNSLPSWLTKKYH